MSRPIHPVKQGWHLLLSCEPIRLSRGTAAERRSRKWRKMRRRLFQIEREAAELVAQQRARVEERVAPPTREQFVAAWCALHKSATADEAAQAYALLTDDRPEVVATIDSAIGAVLQGLAERAEP